MTPGREETGDTLSAIVIDHATNPRNAGSMDDADAYASVLGSCGDNMEMWLRARDGKVIAISFWTDGCTSTIACGSMVTELAKGKTLGEALTLSAEIIFKSLGGLPKNHVHCAGLASLTLKKTIIEYLNFKKEPWKKAYQKY